MPGKLGKGTGALGLLASAYSLNSGSEDEEEFADKTPITKEKKMLKEQPIVVDLCGSSELSKESSLRTSTSVPVVQPAQSCANIISKYTSQDQKQPHQLLAPTSKIVTSMDENVELALLPVTMKDQNETTLIHELKERDANNDDLQIVEFNFNAETFTAARATEESKSDGSDSDSDLSDTGDSEEDSDSSEGGTKKGKNQPPRVNGEFLLSDLPPIEDLYITVPHEQCEAIGVVKSVVDSLVVVESYQNSLALNLDTVLFLEVGDRTLGQIFDVFGPVKQPHYCVRFNSKDHISSRGVEIGMLVYCAPKTKHTKYVFLAQLRRLRGTDASWKDDIEPPPEEMDFSDDEVERGVKNNKNGEPRGEMREGQGDGHQTVNNAEKPFQKAAQGYRGRGQKRPANNPTSNNFQPLPPNQTTRAFIGPPFNKNAPFPAQSPYVPAFAPGFGPPNRRFQNYGRPHFNPSYDHEYYTTCPLRPPPYFQSYPYPRPQSPMNNRSYFPRHQNTGHVPQGHYLLPTPIPSTRVSSPTPSTRAPFPTSRFAHHTFSGQKN